MKIIENLTGQTGVSNIQIQKAISHLLIVKTGTTSAVTNETLSAALQVGSNQHAIATKIKIKDMAVISQYENGYIMQQVDSDSKVKSCLVVELTGIGQGMILANNDYITMDLSNLQSTATYNIYGLEAPKNDRLFLNYVAQNLTGTNSQTKAFTLNPTHKGIYISNNSSLEKIRLFTNDGNEVSYFPEELAAIAREVNSVTIMADSLIEGDALNQTISGGATDFYYVPAEGFKGFEITTVGGVELTFVLTEVRRY